MFEYEKDRKFCQDSFRNVVLWNALSHRAREGYVMDVHQAKEILYRMEKPLAIEQYFCLLQQAYHGYNTEELIKGGVWIEFEEGAEILKKVCELFGMDRYEKKVRKRPPS